MSVAFYIFLFISISISISFPFSLSRFQPLLGGGGVCSGRFVWSTMRAHNPRTHIYTQTLTKRKK